jgi:ferredoxin
VRARAFHGRDQWRSGGAGDRRLPHPHRTIRPRTGCDPRHRSNTREGAPPTRRQPGNGPTIEFARSDLAVSWDNDYGSLLELAEACDVPVRWSCRTGVCHTCETTLIAGDLKSSPDPVEPPADGSALICCSQPRDDVVLDL